MTKKKKPKTARLDYEHRFYAAGFRHIVGIDEAGRGAWAGPVTAGAVCLPITTPDLTEQLLGVRDSKTMTARQRGLLVENIKTVATAWGVGCAASAEIDTIGIVPATKLAMRRALEHMQHQYPAFTPDCLFLDTMRWDDSELPYQQEHILKGDQHSLSVAAASVIAKTWRDAYMRDLVEDYPDYGFEAHKGYGTLRHVTALKQCGITPEHRLCYRPIRELLT